MRFTRWWLLSGTALVLSIAVGCTSGDLGPVGPSEATTELATLDPVDPLPTLSLLSCSPQRYLTATSVVGPKGGKIKVGSHVLTIPAGALSADVTIVAEQLTGSVNSVRFGPEGLTFAVPAALTMSYTNCMTVVLPKSVVYTDERLKVLELLQSVDKAQTKTVTSPIDHFSRYAVAY
ncbi:MAG TPA: hypothetical protein VIM84_06090 [Gemmatimonadales bacterium]